MPQACDYSAITPIVHDCAWYMRVKCVANETTHSCESMMCPPTCEMERDTVLYRDTLYPVDGVYCLSPRLESASVQVCLCLCVCVCVCVCVLGRAWRLFDVRM